MSKEKTARRPGTRLRTVLRALSVGAVVVPAILAASHFAWKYQGSSQWQAVIAKNGITVYSRKTPGSVLKDWRAVMRLRTTLNGAVAAMTSTETADCAEWYPGCESVQSVQPWNSRELTYIHLFRGKYPAPYSPREMVVKARAFQDPQSKAAMVEFVARPNDLPGNECCVRITEYHNTWRFTPLENGESEVELIVHMDQKLPYFLVNRVAPGALYKLFCRLPGLLDKEKWQHARFDSIKEK